jgi:hypothetical protein
MPCHISEIYFDQVYANMTVTSDAFTRREQASEAKYIRDKELERYDHAGFLHSSTMNYERPTETFRLTDESLIASRS